MVAGWWWDKCGTLVHCDPSLWVPSLAPAAAAAAADEGAGYTSCAFEAPGAVANRTTVNSPDKRRTHDRKQRQQRCVVMYSDV